MDPELQGDQNEEYKPPSDIDVNPTRADPPELRDNTGKDLTDPNPADEEGVPGDESTSQNQNQNYSRNSNQRGSQTKSGQPDMRLKENQNQEVSGQS